MPYEGVVGGPLDRNVAYSYQGFALVNLRAGLAFEGDHRVERPCAKAARLSGRHATVGRLNCGSCRSAATSAAL